MTCKKRNRLIHLILPFLTGLTLATNHADSYTWHAPMRQPNNASPSTRYLQDANDRIATGGRTPGTVFDSDRYEGYQGEFNSNPSYFTLKYYAYREEYDFATYTPLQNCLPEDLECLQDAEIRIRHTKILIASIIGLFVLFVSILTCSFVCECCKCCKCQRETCCSCFKNEKERASVGGRAHQKGAHSGSHLSAGGRSSGASTGSAPSGSPTAITD